MNKMKSFITKNKILVTMTSVVTMSVFLIFTVIAVAISGTPSTPSAPSSTEDSASSDIGNVADSSTEGDSFPHYTGENDSCGSEDESTTEEETTEPPVDPYTLPYMIMVNRAANCVTVYGKDDSGEFTVPVKAITVSCGKNVGDTPTGTYQTINEYNWRQMVDDTFGQYAYRIVGSILFHSVPYYTQSKADLEWEEFNKLGTSASLGCIRMSVGDAKWLMDNCPIGTLVKIYDDAANPGPLGKPDTIKIPEDSPYRGWDPTDPDPANPWKQFSATLTLPATNEITVMEGASIENILAQLSAKDTCGNDISAKIQISGNFDLAVPGTYSDVVVSVTDAIGSHAEATVTIIVQGNETDSSENESSSEGESSSENESTSEGESSSEGESASESEPTSEGESPSESESASEGETTSESGAPGENN